MKRFLFNLAWPVSALASLAFAAVWVRSYFITDEFRINSHHIDASEISIVNWNCWYGRGGMTVMHETGTYSKLGWESVFNKHAPVEFEHNRMGSPPSYPLMDDSPSLSHSLGFGIYGYQSTGESKAVQTAVTVPFYAICSVLVILPIAAMRKMLRRRTARQRAFEVVLKS